MQITFTGDPQKDAALLREAEELHILAPIEPDDQIEKKIRNLNLNYSELRAVTGSSAEVVGRSTVGIIKCQSDDMPCEY